MRPRKNNVDYFPFIVKEGKTMTVIKNRYGKDGWTVWTRTLRQLALTDYHYLDFNDDLTLPFMAADCWVSEDRYKEIINDLVKFKEFDQNLWAEGVLYSEIFIERLAPAYKKRDNKPLTPDELLDRLISLGILKPGFRAGKGGFRVPIENDTPKKPEKTQNFDKNDTLPEAGAKSNPLPKPGKSTPKPGKSTPKPHKQGVSGTNNTQRKEKKRKALREMSKQQKKSTQKPPENAIPYKNILSLYHKILPELPKVQKLTDQRKRHIKARWKEHNDFDWWEFIYLPKIRDSDFLMHGKDTWRGADFDFIMNSSKMVKILEGNYDNFKNKRSGKNAQQNYKQVARQQRHEKPESTIS